MNIDIVCSELKNQIENIISLPLSIQNFNEVSTFLDFVGCSLSANIKTIKILNLECKNKLKKEYKMMLSIEIKDIFIYFDYCFNIENGKLINNMLKTYYYISSRSDLTCYINPYSDDHVFIESDNFVKYFSTLNILLKKDSINYHESVHKEYIKLNDNENLGHVKVEFTFQLYIRKMYFIMIFYNRNNKEELKQINLVLSSDFFSIDSLNIGLSVLDPEWKTIQNEPLKYLPTALSKKYNIDYDVVFDMISSGKNFNIFKLPEIIEYLRLLKY